MGCVRPLCVALLSVGGASAHLSERLVRVILARRFAHQQDVRVGRVVRLANATAELDEPSVGDGVGESGDGEREVEHRRHLADGVRRRQVAVADGRRRDHREIQRVDDGAAPSARAARAALQEEEDDERDQ